MFLKFCYIARRHQLFYIKKVQFSNNTIFCARSLRLRFLGTFQHLETLNNNFREVKIKEIQQACIHIKANDLKHDCTCACDILSFIFFFYVNGNTQNGCVFCLFVKRYAVCEAKNDGTQYARGRGERCHPHTLQNIFNLIRHFKVGVYLFCYSFWLEINKIYRHHSKQLCSPKLQTF